MIAGVGGSDTRQHRIPRIVAVFYTTSKYKMTDVLTFAGRPRYLGSTRPDSTDYLLHQVVPGRAWLAAARWRIRIALRLVG